MPFKPKKPCAYPGCPNLTHDKYCEQHKKEGGVPYDKLKEKEYDKSRSYVHKKRYNKQWEAVRKAYIIADNKLAEKAGWDEELLAIELEALKDDGFDLLMTGFSEEEIAKLLSDGEEAEVQDDDFDLTSALEQAVPDAAFYMDMKFGGVRAVNEKPILRCVSISGGKDSTALVLKMVEKGMPIDLLLFCDTGLEFPALYRHLDKLEKTIGIPITRIKADESFEYLFRDHPLKRGRSETFIRNYGDHPNGYGWPGPKTRWCTGRLKIQPRERFLREPRKKYHVIRYVGIAADEIYRLERKNNQREDVFFPLVEWGMTEADCLQYCYDRGFDWEGLYNYFSRVSCWC